MLTEMHDLKKKIIPGDENKIYITKMFILSERVIPEPSDVGLPPAVRL